MSYLYATWAAYFKSAFAVLHFLVRRHFTPVNARNNCLDLKKKQNTLSKRFKYVWLHCEFHSHQSNGRGGDLPDSGWEADWKSCSIIAN